MGDILKGDYSKYIRNDRLTITDKEVTAYLQAEVKRMNFDRFSNLEVTFQDGFARLESTINIKDLLESNGKAVIGTETVGTVTITLEEKLSASNGFARWKCSMVELNGIEFPVYLAEILLGAATGSRGKLLLNNSAELPAGVGDVRIGNGNLVIFGTGPN